MPDVFDPEERSRIMALIRGRDTKPELVLRRALWACGVRGWRCHRPSVPGKPDISFGLAKVAVFVDGAFWHGHPSKFTPGKSGEFWDTKIAKNVRRDEEINVLLGSLGWTVLRYWDFEVTKDAFRVAEEIKSVLEERRHELT